MNNTLQSWLETATHNLAPRAVTQISNEITAHVQSATAQHQLEGTDEELALELAVRELGSAKAAARGYRQAHLTLVEIRGLQRADSIGRLLQVLSVLAFAFGAGLQLMGRSVKWDFVAITFAQIVCGVLVLWSDRSERLEHRAVNRMLGVFALCVGSGIASAMNLTSNEATWSRVVYPLMTFCCSSLVVIQWLQWRKIRRVSSHSRT